MTLSSKNPGSVSPANDSSKTPNKTTRNSNTDCQIRMTKPHSHATQTDRQDRPGEVTFHLDIEIQELRRTYPQWDEEVTELYLPTVGTASSYSDQKLRNTLMQDALLKLDVTAGSKKDVQMFKAHWKAATPFAQQVTSLRQCYKHQLCRAPVGRA